MVRATFAGITTALSSLQANQKRLDIVGQNLSNMNTPGYTRQQLDVSSLNHLSPVSHYANGAEITVGFGVKMDGVSRIRDPYLDVQYRDHIGKPSYNEAMQTSLDTLAKFLDEHTISGIRQAFDDVQSVLTNAQDPPKVNDPIYNSELRARMQALTNTINDAARQIVKAEEQEYEVLNGDGTSENGAVQTINDLLKRIGDLNVQIKRNQIVDQPSLELMDERDLLLDQLASYVPIEVTYFKDHPNRDDWPYDVRVDMVYNNGTTENRITLVNGSEGGRGNNYGSVIITDSNGTFKTDNNGFVLDSTGKPEINGGNTNNPIHTKLGFTQAPGAPNSPVSNTTSNMLVIKASDTPFATGSIQSSLDMLGKKGTDMNTDKVRGYQYYMDQLNTLAKTFADTINEINNKSVEYNGKRDGALLEYTTGSVALTLKISAGWADDSVKLGTGIPGTNTTPSANDTALEMLAAFEKIREFTDSTGKKSNNTFAGFMNHVSTILATDSYANQQALKTNVTVLNGIQDSRDSISGVSLDEEASNMMAYLNAYNAASRLMTALDEALNTLINNTGLVGR